MTDTFNCNACCLLIRLVRQMVINDKLKSTISILMSVLGFARWQSSVIASSLDSLGL